MVAKNFYLAERIAKKVILPSNREQFANKSDDDFFFYDISLNLEAVMES